jgi:transposase
MRAAGALLAEVSDAFVIGDKAYDAPDLRAQLRRQRSWVVIPSHPTRRIQRRYDRVLYRMPDRVENFFQRPKRFRRIATRYDALARTFLGMVSFAAAPHVDPLRTRGLSPPPVRPRPAVCHGEREG